jgi:hypothetical protein
MRGTSAAKAALKGKRVIAALKALRHPHGAKLRRTVEGGCPHN